MGMRIGLSGLLAWVVALNCSLQAQQVTRGPYLQNANDQAITVKWRTDSLCDSRVRFGPDPGNLTQAVTDSVPTYNHTVRITGLAPYSRYYYAAGTSTMDLEGGDSSHHFHTNPVPGTVQPIKIWALGDFGRNNPQEYWVRDSYARLAAADRPADVWVWLGDNAYDIGTDSQYTQRVFNVYDSIFDSQIFWPCPGNHDYYSVNQNGLPPTHTGPYYNIIEVPTNGEAGGVPSGGEMYYSFDYGNVHFVSMNSELGSWIFSTNTPLTQWLEADLQATTQPWKIIYFHQPPHSKGSHSSDNFWETNMVAMRNNIMPIVERHGVDLVLSGHSHVYERSKLMHGFYDWSFTYSPSYEVDGGSGNEALGEQYMKSMSGLHPNRGTVYAVVGNGGSYAAWAPLDHPMMHYGWTCDTCVGSMMIDVIGDTLRAKYFSSQGNVMDQFSIYKDLTVDAAQPRPSGQHFKVLPNPFTDRLELEVDLPRESRLWVVIVDIAGQEVHREKWGKLAPGLHRLPLDAATLNLPAGVYLLQLTDGVQNWTQRIVKQHD